MSTNIITRVGYPIPLGARQSGAATKARHYGTLANSVNAFLAARFKARVHANVSIDPAITSGDDPDQLYEGNTWYTHRVRFQADPLSAGYWVGFSHTAAQLVTVKDGGVDEDTRVEVSLHLASSGAVIGSSRTVYADELFRVPENQRGITKWQGNSSVQLGLYGQVGYWATPWNDLFGVTDSEKGRDVYLKIRPYGARIYSVDIIGALTRTID